MTKEDQAKIIGWAYRHLRLTTSGHNTSEEDQVNAVMERYSISQKQAQGFVSKALQQAHAETS
jgi:hypothetical protein